MKLSGANVLVTGASRGLGAALAEGLCQRGASVLGTSRKPEPSADSSFRMAQLDLSSVAALEESWRNSGLGDVSFDIVINNAGSGVFGEFAEDDARLFDQQVELLLSAQMHVCRLALPSMIESGSGLIVNVSSLAAEYPIPFMSGYNAAKAGLSAFSASLRMELEPCGVKVIDFRPGDFDTGFAGSMQRGAFSSFWKDKGVAAIELIEQRMKRMPSAEAISCKLLKAIEKDRSGIVRAGSFFQAKLAPLFARFSPQSLHLSANKSYYKLKN